MGLTNCSVGRGAVDSGLHIRRQEEERVIALAGNPNVGKSTVFNALTGLNQHTGNWPGKTVANAQGVCNAGRQRYLLVDIPGTYSLLAHSAEEEVARNFICFGDPDRVVVVCDATCLERNLNLVLQTMETGARVVVCVNLMDEARRKGIRVDIERLQAYLGVPVVATVARQKKSLRRLLEALEVEHVAGQQPVITYARPIEEAVAALQPLLSEWCGDKLNSRWLALRLLDRDPSLTAEIGHALGEDFLVNDTLCRAVAEQKAALAAAGLEEESLRDALAAGAVKAAEKACAGVVTFAGKGHADMDRRIDRVLTGRRTAYPVMLLLLAVVLWITIVGANTPSAALSTGLFWVEDQLCHLFTYLGAPAWLDGAVVHGMYRVLAWVVAVMLPPMAIFFPLFTLLEDVGYLPRIAYNLDRPFHRCHACGKQALTMCMGFGCNAAGVVGCRIIDSPRERLLAILTNSFVPCNGRFPTLITLITLFFAVGGGLLGSLSSALLLTGVILLGIGATLLTTRLLAVTVLRGTPSSFTLELPPYRPPQVGRVLVRSLLDRTVFVLGRAAAVAAPAGLLIWLLANVTVGSDTLLTCAADFLDPFASFLGLDGAILLAFILGFPANEIVLPLTLMIYMSEGTLTDMADLTQLGQILAENGWTWLTAACTVLFSLFHWPCSTTLLTVKKETGSLKWTLLAAALPTALGMLACMALTWLTRWLG